MLDTALEALASGTPGSVSGNRIAKDAGATWGTVKYQFGDIDGLWAAVLRHTAQRRGTMPSHAAPHGPLAQRVAGILDVMYDGLSTIDSRAIENLRAALPRDRAELEQHFPQTAAELASWQKTWIADCQNAFSDLDVDPARVREVALFIPGAMRGITSERQLGSYIDLDEARHGLSNAIVAYLENSG
jgi:AcrR family transcriptional regulator